MLVARAGRGDPRGNPRRGTSDSHGVSSPHPEVAASRTGPSTIASGSATLVQQIEPAGPASADRSAGCSDIGSGRPCESRKTWQGLPNSFAGASDQDPPPHDTMPLPQEGAGFLVVEETTQYDGQALAKKHAHPPKHCGVPPELQANSHVKTSNIINRTRTAAPAAELVGTRLRTRPSRDRTRRLAIVGC